ncbi:2-C-methyl-D-erythritol 2,4-cyclodiphosphate synthase [Deefgea tanakiae]|uniref:2-C-methyl-D-erythritol 2,4-cyclodiphosphate synthase n=1 Tax=Deefgea tanakiae TaxID=2865840 RepID=A0ABX8Z5V7_9NEIS|nr:2-C-methyl-D-erythritol 2,4-cyclodiphosphate synthase [Deefgea tanakiae]QZA77968.1 2-C-methyl-D-erythritol 2,4-cyclodiphosphate synthase [Deefgea tanakiae]
MALPFRVGQGWDVHRMVLERSLILGGVHIPYEKGLLGHSDADALLHAITDAVLGGAGLGDIGRHFPDTAPEFKGADSRVLLREAVRRAAEAGWLVGNLDATVLIQQPKMAPHIPEMVKNIAEDLCVDVACVNVKAKTYEKLGPVGHGESVEAQAIVLLLPRM